jgi:tetratricopeptide (TPR) repeat protein
VLRIAEPLWMFWQLRGLAAEGREWLEWGIPEHHVSDWNRAGAQNAAGYLAWVQGDYDRAEVLLDAALPLSRRLGNQVQLGQSLFFRALVFWQRGDFPAMVASLTEAQSRFRSWADLNGEAVCLLALGVVTRLRQEHDLARGMFDRAYDLCQQTGFDWGIATARYYAGEVARDQHDDPQAARLLGEALGSYWSQGDGWGTGACIAALACLAVERGDLVAASRLFGAGFALCEKAGAFFPPTDLAVYRAVASQARDRVGIDSYELNYASGRNSDPEKMVAEAREFAAAVDHAVPAHACWKPARLTRTQLEVVRLIAAGYEPKTIAKLRHRRDSSTYEVLDNIRQRWQLSSIRDIAPYAVRHGVVPPPPLENPESLSSG